MRKIVKTAFLASVLLFASLGVAQNLEKTTTKKIENSLLWEISGNGLTKPSYLYGTVHMMCESDFLMKEKVKIAFEKTEELALELDFDDPKELQNMQKLALAAEPLSKVLTKDEYATLEALLKNNYALEIKQFENFNLIGIMSTLMFKQLNCTPKMYEIEFLKMAKNKNEIIHGLETVDDQIKAFTGSYTNAEFIKQFEEYDAKYFDELMAYYKKEELSNLWNMTTNDKFMDKDSQEIMLDNRNINWIKKMPNMMQQHSVFFAVGAAHLPGENGVINLLQKAGYTVKSIEK